MLRGAPGIGDVRDPLPVEIRDPSFSTAVRGYDRHAVDRYVERVNCLIAELQVSGSPRAAVRHALDRVGEQTSGILQRARETAEEIITSAREDAEETTRRARAEAHDIVAGAEREAGEVASRAAAEAEELVASATARSEEMLGQATVEAERAVAGARADAQTRIERATEEIDALREQAEAQMRELEHDIVIVAEHRRTLLADAKALAARLAQVVADAETADPGRTEDNTPGGEPPTAAGTVTAAPVDPPAGETDRGPKSTAGHHAT